METMILKDPTISPAKKNLEEALGKTYAAYEELITEITSKEFDLSPEWRYYKDGKAWLCKVQYKKKTVFWLSVWDKYFKIAFYFTEKNLKSIEQVKIDPKIKDKLVDSNPIGKLFPLAIEIHKRAQLKDALRIIEYKKSLI
jgi:Protein of unknown function (DUF3788)